jgi:hypothetical protein
MGNNPFQQKFSRIKPKTRGDREYRDGRTYLKNKTELRQVVFERSKGFCEDTIDLSKRLEYLPAKLATGRCNAPITWESMELSHLRHGIHRDDSERGTIASCKSCHQKRHASAKVPRRPGKIMKISDARVYWEGNSCFCCKDKKFNTSFCPECQIKLHPQTAYTLENADDPDAYREALAQAENEILLYDLEHK